MRCAWFLQLDSRTRSRFARLVLPGSARCRSSHVPWDNICEIQRRAMRQARGVALGVVSVGRMSQGPRMSVSRYVWGVLGVGLLVSGAVVAAPKGKFGGQVSWKPGSFKPEEARKRFHGALSKGKETLDKQKKQRDDQHKACGYGDQPNTCSKPAAVTLDQLDVDKSLFVHDRATIDAGGFTLQAVLDQLAGQAVAAGAPGVTGSSLFKDFWDTQNPATPSTTTAHCDDNGQTLNGFPVSCRTGEGQQISDPAGQIAKYQAIGVVNRLDLAHEGWSNCGEHRIVFGRNDGSRNFMIFEAVLPNPNPGCRAGCRPVAEFWSGLSDPALSAEDRGKALHDFYFNGLPGFRPVVHIDHYASKAVDTSNGSVGSGQIRTNQFLQGPWLLKEFSLALDCGASPCALQVVPTMVKSNPFGALWVEEVAGDSNSAFSTRAADFQAALLHQVSGLSGKKGDVCPSNGAELTAIGYSVNPEQDAAESGPQNPAPPDNFLAAFDPAATPVTDLFRDSLAKSPDLCGLSTSQLINRATAQSCAGCHQPSTFGLLDPGALGTMTLPGGTTTTSWPNSLGFVHTREIPDANGVHQLSPALTDVFLPARRSFLLGELNADVCSCERTFDDVDPSKREKAHKTQQKVNDKFKNKRAKEWQQLSAAKRKAGDKHKPVSFKDVRDGIKRLGDIAKEQEAELQSELKKDGIEVTSSAVDLKAHPWHLDVAKRANGDKRKERQLRAQVVVEQLRAVPPRRTVTGSFRSE